MSEIAGYVVKVDLEDTPYAVARFTVGDSVAPLEVSNSEGKAGNPDNDVLAPAYSSVIPDLKKGTIRLVSASFDPEDNAFILPIFLEAGMYASVKVYPAGRTGDIVHDYGTCLVLDVQHEGSIPGAQPVTLTLQTDAGYQIGADNVIALAAREEGGRKYFQPRQRPGARGQKSEDRGQKEPSPEPPKEG